MTGFLSPGPPGPHGRGSGGGSRGRRRALCAPSRRARRGRSARRRAGRPLSASVLPALAQRPEYDLSAMRIVCACVCCVSCAWLRACMICVRVGVRACMRRRACVRACARVCVAARARPRAPARCAARAYLRSTARRRACADRGPARPARPGGSRLEPSRASHGRSRPDHGSGYTDYAARRMSRFWRARPQSGAAAQCAARVRLGGPPCGGAAPADCRRAAGPGHGLADRLSRGDGAGSLGSLCARGRTCGRVCGFKGGCVWRCSGCAESACACA